LVPAIATGSDEFDELRRTCLEAVKFLVTTAPDELVVAGSGPAEGTARPGETGSLAGFGVEVTVALGAGPAPSEPRLPLSLTIAAWLLREAGVEVQVHGRVLAATTGAGTAAELGERIAAWPGRTALLVMGDGSACRSEAAPGSFDQRAEAFDAEVSQALAEADLDALMNLDSGLAGELAVAGRPAWQLLAGAARGQSWQAKLTYDNAPRGVGYFVATWVPSLTSTALTAADGAAPTVVDGVALAAADDTAPTAAADDTAPTDEGLPIAEGRS
jgi:hypothetical protein